MKIIIFFFTLSVLISSCTPVSGVISEKEYRAEHLEYQAHRKIMVNVPEQWIILIEGVDEFGGISVTEDEWNSCLVGEIYPDCTRD